MNSSAWGLPIFTPLTVAAPGSEQKRPGMVVVAVRVGGREAMASAMVLSSVQWQHRWQLQAWCSGGRWVCENRKPPAVTAPHHPPGCSVHSAHLLPHLHRSPSSHPQQVIPAASCCVKLSCGELGSSKLVVAGGLQQVAPFQLQGTYRDWSEPLTAWWTQTQYPDLKKSDGWWEVKNLRNRVLQRQGSCKRTRRGTLQHTKQLPMINELHMC